MLGILALILPLDLASTLSPIILAITVVLLSAKSHSKEKIIAFFIGSLIIGIFVTILGYNLGQKALMGDKHSEPSYMVDLLIGAFFILFAIKSFFSKERKTHPREDESGKKILKWFLFGIIVSITNFDALFLNLTAAKEVAIAEGITQIVKFFLLCMNLFFFTLPITFPILMYLLFPVVANRVLAKVNNFLLKYGKYIIAVLFFIFGLIFLYRGLAIFS
ncbi:MAG: GAP family protein [Patescibacteria group bacterium]|nr:GAP family protein [Patescibacteria group bacterium]